MPRTRGRPSTGRARATAEQVAARRPRPVTTGRIVTPRRPKPAPAEQVAAPRRPKPAPALAGEPSPKALVKELLQEPVPGPVRILFLDVDGTLTDGAIVFDRNGDSRRFWIRDGLALQWARELGVIPVAISGRASRAVERRLSELGVEYHLGIGDKVAVAERVLESEGVTWNQCVMVGDDLPDVPLMKRVGWPIAVADAMPEVLAVARTVTGARGGRGAVREVVEMVLRHNGAWNRVLERYEALP